MQEAIQQWRRFTARMKKAFPGVAFLRVPERHQDGAVHFHAVMFGMPENLACEFQKRGRYWTHCCPKSRPCERKVRTLAKLWGHGFVDLQQVRKPERVGAYIAGYLTKNKPDWSLFGLHVASANGPFYEKISAARTAGSFFEASNFNKAIMVDHLLRDLDDPSWRDAYDVERVASVLRKQSTFTTQWLGQAIFQVYEILDT